MKWDDIKGVIGSAAPLVGSLLGGPVGGTVGQLVAHALGVEDTPEAIVEEIKQNPEALLKLKQFEYTHSEKLQELSLQEAGLYLKDRQNSREREQAIVKATGHVDYNLYLLAWLIVGGFFALTALLAFHSLPEDSSGVIFMLFGTLAGSFGAVIQYFFGSSKSSSEKTKLLTAQTPKG